MQHHAQPPNTPMGEYRSLPQAHTVALLLSHGAHAAPHARTLRRRGTPNRTAGV